MSLALVARRLIRLAQHRVVLQASGPGPFDTYRDDPEGFARYVLKVTLTPLQVDVARLLLVPPYRVLVPSANNMGKTHAAAAITLWWFCTRRPCTVLTTAPKYDQVRD